jgi:hypothetical protein
MIMVNVIPNRIDEHCTFPFTDQIGARPAAWTNIFNLHDLGKQNLYLNPHDVLDEY